MIISSAFRETSGRRQIDNETSGNGPYIYIFFTVWHRLQRSVIKIARAHAPRCRGFVAKLSGIKKKNCGTQGKVGQKSIEKIPGVGVDRLPRNMWHHS